MRVNLSEQKFLIAKYKREGLSQNEIYKRLGSLFQEETKITQDKRKAKKQLKETERNFKDDFKKICNPNF